ncbi:MAG TPA: DUF1569 domain-containing protein [Candidatus Saccharimonadales bacterium]|nr:DUF1569 domain-containing protein [Candidatus Saccharimonadales bacterium]
MTAHQMICHLCDSFRGPLGERPIAPVTGVRGRALMKWFALSTPIPWPRGLTTTPEANQQIAGTPPAEFAADVQELRRLLELFTQSPRKFSWEPHPIFSEMTDSQWMRWGYLHMDHHFRQFGA